MEREPSEKERFEVLFELAQKDLQLVAEGYVGLDARMGRIEHRMDLLEGRMDRLEGRMDRLEGRMDRLEGRMDQLSMQMERGFTMIQTSIEALTKELHAHIQAHA